MKEKSPRPPVPENAPAGHHPAAAASPLLVAAIGAAKGALTALREILAGIAPQSGVAVIVLHHPELAGRNLMALLRRRAPLEVVEAVDGMRIQADRIHVMPSDRFLNIAADILTHSEPVHCNGLLMPIDHFFCSLAADRRERCCGIVLSGAGSDGTLGLSEIRAQGGRTIVQDPQESPLSDMPQSAVAAGTADAVLPAGRIAGDITERAGQLAARNHRLPAKPNAGLDAILDILRSRTGQDFRCYKPNTLERRIHRRMALDRIETLEEYARHLSDHPDEAGLLQHDLLIGVTEFFRQPQAWETLERKVIVPLIGNGAAGSTVRVWTPGCSSGREVYSLAMLMAEQAEKSGRNIDFQIFATDTDVTALATARAGIYGADEIGPNVSPERLKKFFTRRDNGFQIIKTLRSRIVFAAQNLTADPPFHNLDLVVCRNLLIYLDQPMQKRIVTLFHFALHEERFLFLGNAETIGDGQDLFEPISKKWRIYRRIGVGRRVSADIPLHPANATATAAPIAPATAAGRPSLTATAQQVLLDRFTPACVMINRKLQVLYTHGAIENYLTLPAGELTTRVTDMAREGLRARLAAAITKCIESGRTAALTACTRRGKKSVPIRATVIPLRHYRESDGLLLITFEDRHLPGTKSGGQTADGGDIRQLADELKITREELQSTIDQLEGSNDQLKAANEEVMAANEELQAANEEMETSKEELQSLNEELGATNLRLQEKVEELEIASNDVLNLLASTNIATVFLDKGFRIKRYTPAIMGLMSLIPSDRGRSLGDILLRFTDEALLDDARRVLTDLTPLAKEVRADSGRWLIRRITPYRTQDDRIEGVVITFVDVTDLKRAEEGLRESQRRMAVIMDSIADGFFALDRQWRFTHINDEALAHFRKSPEEVIGHTLFEVFPAVRGTVFETWYRHAMEGGEPVHFEAHSQVADMMMEVHAYPGPENLTVLFRNVTERSRMAQALKEAHERAAWLARFPGENPNPVVRVSAEGRVLYANPTAARTSGWSCVAGDPLPAPLRPLVAQAVAKGGEVQQDIRWGDRTFAVSVVWFPDESYANLYGRDITKRILAETALRQSELRAATLLNTAGESIWLFSPDGRVLAANTTAAQRVGKTVDEVVGMKWADLLSADLAGSRGEKIAEVLRTGKPARFEDERAGIVFDHAFYPARDGEGNITGVAAFSQDITGRKRAEEALKRLNAELEERVGRQTAEIQRTFEALHGERQRLHDVLEMLPVYVVLLTPDYRVSFANRTFRERFGEGPGKRCYEHLFGRTEPCEVCETYQVVKTGKPHHWEWLGPDGRDYDVFDFPFTDSDGAPFILEMGIDCTDIKRAEAALREVNETLERRVAERTAQLEAARAEAESGKRLLESVMAALPVGVAITDAKGGNIRSNRAFEAIWGGPRPETHTVTDYAAYRARWAETGKPVEPEAWASARAIREGKTVDGQLLQIEKFDGARAFVLNSASPIVDTGGRIVGAAVAIQDVTDLKRAEEALRESEAAVRQKLDSILSPEGDIGELELADIIDVPALQSLMADFYDLAGIPMSIIDLKGRVIVGVGWQEVCTKFHRAHPETGRHCLESDTQLSSGVLPGESRLYKCRNAMWDVATPIIVGGKHLGNVFSGQFFFDDEQPDYDLFRAQARRYGFDEASYIGALERVPRFTREEVKTGMAFFMKFADLISQQSYANIKLARSLTERDALMAELAASEERLKIFIEHAPAALAMFDRRMHYLGVSRRWRLDYGLGDAELAGRSHYDLFPDISEAWKEAHRRGLAGEVVRSDADRVVRADGTAQWLRWEIRPWYDAAGAVGGIVIFTRDITELMEAHEALEDRSEQLTAANKELESFSYSVSHDLQAPLRAIDGYSRMILRKHADRFDADALEKFNVIRSSTQMMGRLIEDLLAFSRLGKAQLSTARLEMDVLFAEVWEEIRAANPDRLLTFTIGEMPSAMGDRNLIRQVVVNVLSNAVKFTRERPEARIEAGGFTSDKECIFSVRDNGVGFDMAYHDKMFGVFQRLHSSEEYEGTGVGLAIVQRIIHRHGGRVWAEGKVGSGSCFYFSIPP